MTVSRFRARDIAERVGRGGFERHKFFGSSVIVPAHEKTPAAIAVGVSGQPNGNEPPRPIEKAPPVPDTIRNNSRAT